MHTLVVRILDALFPPSADMRIVRQLSAYDVRRLYNRAHHSGMVALSEFKDSRVRALIHETKFHGNEHAGALLAALVDQFIQDAPTLYDVMIPIPLSSARRRKRGYNQVEEVLRKVSTGSAPKLDTRTLVRTKDTRPQTDLDRAKRLKNMRGAFIVKEPARIEGKRILLIDDVTTTGATLHEAKAALLLHSPASVTCLALAH